MSGDSTCVIGMGFSGLAAGKALHTRGLPFTCVERSSGVGGLWRYPADGESGPAYASLHLNTSGKVTGYSDFPMPHDYPRYARHDQVRAYLEDYAVHFGLSGKVEFRTEVVDVRPAEPSGWDVTTVDLDTGGRTTRRFAHVIAATGHHWKPVRPDPAIPGAEEFTGTVSHAVDYREPRVYSGRRVLIVGIGNSACDIAVELSRVARRTVLAMRRGAHVVPKQLMGIPIDEIAGRWWWSRMPFRVQRRFLELLLRIIRGPITDYGMPDPGHRILSAPITISDELLSRVTHGGITPKPMVERFAGAKAHFVDGTVEEFDDVIYCTGYEIAFPYLPRESVFADSGQVALYRGVVPPDHSGLYLVGLVRPVGAITRLVEIQSEWIADLVAGIAVLPERAEMVAEVDGRISRAGRRYGGKPVDSIHVDFGAYLRTVRQERTKGRRRAR
ncbi:flavin-containing monooxygenase [Actinokineospora sp.]|uniref:flavin-containing monooxygenase n=1 Tax=Actinokineospora sp. TaxID=1872133 RepID=UPI004037F51D